MKDEIQKLLANALKKLSIEGEMIDVQHPSNASYGDYSTSIALKLAKKLKKNPIELAQQITNDIPKNPHIEKIEVVKPGFINFWVSKDYLFDVVLSGLDNKNKTSKNRMHDRVIVEYTDPNIFKEFHIGHMYSNIVGESISRMLEITGSTVYRVNYQGDVGMHVAKALWGLQTKMTEEKITLEEIGSKKLDERINFLGQAYSIGTQSFESDERAKKEIIKLNKMIYNKDQTIWALYQAGKQWSLDYFEEIYKKFETNNGKGQFDDYFFESEVAGEGKKQVELHMKNNIFEKSQGAIIFPGKKYGLHDRVFINSLGLPTYEAKELGLATVKYNRWKYDKSIIVVGTEIKEYFKVLLKALEKTQPELAKRTMNICTGMIRLPEGKMSSRTGNIITAESLLVEISNKIYSIIQKTTKTNITGYHAEYKQNRHNITPTDQINISETVALAAIKYALLRNTIGKDIEFNLEESVSFEGNSGPYLLYTYVRCRSVLEKQKGTISTMKQLNYGAMNIEDLTLLRLLFHFPEIIEQAAHNFAPNYIVTYLYNLAQQFNLFYQKNPILKTEKNAMELRLMLTQATAQTLQKGLYLLGIKTVEKM